MKRVGTRNYELRCISCNALNSERETTTYCTECGSVLTVIYSESSSDVQYPIQEADADPLKSTLSPLVSLPGLSKMYGADLHAKLDFYHPTGCFKDRGSYIEVQKALELNKEAICVASTGNMAASVSAYACYFDLPCFIFVPEKTEEAKLAQATIYNANIIRIKGDFTTCEDVCRKFSQKNDYYLAGDYVFRGEGQKVFSYELYEQGDPHYDYIFIPIGCGTNYAAIWKGYKEMKAGGLIDRLPRLVAVQAQHCSPVVEGINKRKKVISDSVNTMATSAAVPDPVDFQKVLEAKEESDGMAITVSENEILSALREMAVVEGHFTEPASALPLAAFIKQVDQFKDQKCLFALTGTGLKDTKVVTKHSLASPVLPPDIEQVQNFVESGYLSMQKRAWGESRETLVANLKMDPAHQQLYDHYLSRIHQKGKTLTPEETETLQSLVYGEQTNLVYPVKVTDYELTMHMHGLVKAEVKMEINGEEFVAYSEGVGPLDAVLTAVKSKSDSLLPLQVADHQVEMLSPDTESLVVATLRLTHDNQQFEAKAASPDTIEATLEAFLKGLAMAYKKSGDSDY